MSTNLQHLVEQLRAGTLSPVAMALLLIAALLACWLAFKVGKFVLKLVLVLLAVGAVAVGLWWFLLPHS